MKFRRGTISLMKIVEKIPIIGGLTTCQRRDFSDAGKDLGIGLFFSLSPIWIWIFSMSISKRGESMAVIDILKDTVSHGELFLYCTSLLAPIFYMALAERQSTRTFPNKLSHIVVVVFVIILSSIFFLLNRMGEELNQQNVFYISLFFYVISVILIYVAKVYANSLLSPAKEFHNQEKNFVTEYNRHRQ